MENQRTIGRHPLAWLAAALLSACSAAPLAVAPPAPLRPVQLGITQAGSGLTARYVYCEEPACPSPTRKTPVLQLAPVSWPTRDAGPKRSEPVTGPDRVDLAFPFNSPHLNDADKNLLTQAAASHRGARVEITARSDFVGPQAGQRKVMVARARAMRSIVAKQAQGARITVRHEVAGPARVAEAEQALQRRGTVRFNLPIDVPLKGLPK